MLDLAQDHTAQLTDIQFVHGSTDKLIQSKLRADAVVANMVLHHTPDPQRVLSEGAALLAPGGSFIISDLCPHDQAWAREHCGDLWLGFSPEDLRAWATAAGLEHCAELFFAQRNGFQIQVQHFKRC
jgi:ArsR family transcriptional regulator